MMRYAQPRGAFATGCLAAWRCIELGSTIPAGFRLPDGLPELGEDDETPPPFVERDGDTVTIHFHDVGRFRIDFRDRTVTGFDIAPDTAPCVIDHILDDHVAPRLLSELGETVLHASAVRFGERVALFLGETGAGKSTLAASLHQVGHALLGDDAMIVTGGPDRYWAEAVYPSLRLYPETIEHLIGNDASTRPMADYSDKQHVHLPSVPQAAVPPLPLAAVFFLDGHAQQRRIAADPLLPTMACIKLVEQSFTLDPRDTRCAARRLGALSRLALAVPAFSLSYPHDFACLDEVHAVIDATMQVGPPA